MQRRFALIKHTHSLDDLGDFFVSSPTDGQVLEYDSVTGKWVNVDVASLGGLGEAVQDIVGAALTDTSSVNFTYVDATGLITADVLPAGVDHDSLLNFVADEHVAHSGVTLTAGAGLIGGGTIAADRSFAVGAGTGITVNADDVALSAATQASLLLADSSIQPGDSNALLTNGAGYITSTSLPVGANPAASVGLTAVNGSAATFLRSDGAPALDRAIRPTWTDTHTFTGTFGSHTIKLQSVLPRIRFVETDAAADNTTWAVSVNVERWEVGLFDDAVSLNQYAIRIDRTNQTVDSVDMSPASQVYFGAGSASAPSISFLSDTDTGIYVSGANTLAIAEGGVGYRIGFRDIPRRTSGFARGECLAVSSGITLNTSGMAAGYAFTVYNDSASAITITQGAGVTLRLAGGATTGNRTLAARGIATIWCNSGTEAIINGNVT